MVSYTHSYFNINFNAGMCKYIYNFNLVSDVGQDSVTSQTSPAGTGNENTLTLPQEPFRSRVSSAHMRQLSNFIISKGQLQLVETLGQG